MNRKIIRLLVFTCAFVLLLAINAITQGNNYVPSQGKVGIGTTNPKVQLEVVGKSQFKGGMSLDSTLIVKDSAEVRSSLIVGHDFKLKGDAGIRGKLSVKDRFVVEGPAKFHRRLLIQDRLEVDGNTQLDQELFLRKYKDSLLSGNRIIGIRPNGKLKPVSSIHILKIDSILKVGRNSLWLAGNQASGQSNDIWTTNGPLSINAAGSQPGRLGYDTYINPGPGSVGIGTDRPSVGTKLEVHGINVNTALKVFANSINTTTAIRAITNSGNHYALQVYPAYSALSANFTIKGSGDYMTNGYGSVGGPVARLVRFRVKSPDRVGICIEHEYPYDWGYGLKALVQRPNTKAIAVVDKTSDEDMFRVMGDGFVYATEIKVQLPPFPDYVFNQDYNLMSLDDVRKFISEKGHLPGLPSAKEIEDSKVGLGALQVKSIEKIEELTLYILELQEQIKAIQTLIAEQGGKDE